MLDCMDCHNRPSHTFAHSAERAVDDAIAAGGFDRALPFVRREAVKVLKATYATRTPRWRGSQTASRVLPGRHPSAPRARWNGPSRRRSTSSRATSFRDEGDLGQLREQRGPHDPPVFPGCFRCHDENHKTGTAR